jgi:hypothetical protein
MELNLEKVKEASDSLLVIQSKVDKNGIKTGKDSSYIIKLNMDLFKDTRNMRSILNSYAAELEKQLKLETAPKKREKTLQLIQICRNPELAVSSILKYMSWAYFILLPIFALILKLFYIRQRHYYLKHLIFSIHLHSFIFIVFILIVALYMIWSGISNWISTVLIFTIPVYVILAQRNFYSQTWLKVFLKFFGISVIYYLILGATTAFVFAKSLGIL